MIIWYYVYREIWEIDERAFGVNPYDDCSLIKLITHVLGLLVTVVVLIIMYLIQIELFVLS